MKSMTVTHLRTHLSRVVNQVARSREGVIVTKRGRPVVQVVPCLSDDDRTPVPDLLAGTLVFEGDIVSPFPADMWESNR